MLYCAICRSESPDDARFCVRCGSSFNPEMRTPAIVSNSQSPSANAAFSQPASAGKAPSKAATGSSSRLAAGGVSKWIIIAIAAIVVVVGIKVLPLFHSDSSAVPVHTTVSLPPTQTSCPSAGTARAAVIGQLAPGQDQNIVYIDDEAQLNNYDTGILKRYDVRTRETSEIVKLDNGSPIIEAQVSADGQWVLFVSLKLEPQGLISQLQMVRMDGQGLQTLYCTPAESGLSNGISDTQWSPDQKHVIFDQSVPGGGDNSMYLLNMSSGQVQPELLTQPNTLTHGFQPITWLDNARVYLDDASSNEPNSVLSILDISKGPNQHSSDLQPIVKTQLPCEGSDTIVNSYDGTKLFLSQCTSYNQGNSVGPYSISIQPTTGGTPQVIYSSPTFSADTIRITSGPYLLLVGGDTNADNNHYGLWEIKPDSSGLTLLVPYSDLFKAFGASMLTVAPLINQFTRYPWSNTSRDGGMYTVQAQDANNNCKLFFGSLSGGPLTTYASSSNCAIDPTGSITVNTILNTIGWTTM